MLGIAALRLRRKSPALQQGPALIDPQPTAGFRNVLQQSQQQWVLRSSALCQRDRGSVTAEYLKLKVNFLSAGCEPSTASSNPSSGSRSTTSLRAYSLFSATLCCASSRGALLVSAKVSQKGALTTSCLVRPAAGDETASRPCFRTILWLT